MKTELWDKISTFCFDDSPGEYGFSTRLASENNWTKQFTEEAILEYKKFMYLAAVSDTMVSPSEIIDAVWHQHLTFTHSYRNFCELIGRQVHHIPSTRTEEESYKFQQAKEKTKALYTAHFGEQPNKIWGYTRMFDSLHLSKAPIELSQATLFGLLITIVLTAPAYMLLKPIYLTLYNPDFVIGYVLLIGCAFVGLYLFNRAGLQKVVGQFDRDSFVYQLQPLELVYLENQNISASVNGVVNELVKGEVLRINSDNTLEKIRQANPATLEEYQTASLFNGAGRVKYETVLEQLVKKPVFQNTVTCMTAFKRYVYQSKQFGILYAINMSVLSVLLILGAVRVMTGSAQGKPIQQILLVVIALLIGSAYHLFRLTSLICTRTIPQFYRQDILPAKQVADDWQWTYFLLGSAALTTSFAPLVRQIEGSSSGGSDGCSSDGCGGGCGGCGGD